jgi:DNA-binding PadR family transcriptional regulator
MTTRTLQILMALSDGPRHGYGIRLAVEERTSGAVVLGSGTLYEAIQRLEADRWIEEVPVPAGEEASGGPPRRFYALTAAGRAALADELGRLDGIVRWARTRDLLPDG